MGSAQAKSSQGSPAHSDGRAIDRLMRDSDRPLTAERAPDDDDTSQAAPRREDELVDGWPTWLLANVPLEEVQGIVRKSADAYDKIEKVGQGTYSNVYKARERATGVTVALKKVRFDASESESVRFMAREMRILQRLYHPNVIRLEGVAVSRMHRRIYLVFDFMCSDLARVIARPGQRLTEPQIKCYMQQLLPGLQHCHQRGILHRDIKPSNLLIDRHGVLKISDFGLANYYGPGRRRPLTSRVVMLWYRAPELLLGSTDYGVGIDLWSAGCILAETFLGKPLLRGMTEVEQLFKIFSLCGLPPKDYWRKINLSPNFKPPMAFKPTMAERFRELPPSSVDLLATLLALDPAARGTAAQALQSSFLSIPQVSIPSPDLHKQFGELLLSQKGVVITFVISGERVAAHRCVLAARSPVFMAELFGDMEEKASPCVEINDMKVEAFRAMLHFIYTDTVPELDQTGEQATVMAQHLLVAADRYGLERLKTICVEELCANISVDTVATTMALAEQHGCSKLKWRCMEFISTPENFNYVAATEGYKHLEASCPSVMNELHKLKVKPLEE